MSGWLTFLRLCAFGAYVAATVRHDVKYDGWVAYLAHTGDVLLFGFNWWWAGKIGRWIDAAPSDLESKP
jgi:hypothetical protein